MKNRIKSMMPNGITGVKFVKGGMFPSASPHLTSKRFVFLQLNVFCVIRSVNSAYLPYTDIAS
jgi:hypothetical protein